MTRARRWRPFGRASVEQEVDDELAFHVDMTMQTLVDGGMSAGDARAEAVRRFGDLAVVAAECRRFGRQRDRHRSRAEYAAELRQDAGFAVRQLKRARSFTAITIATLALGIGATAAVFSALYAVVLHPLPFADASRVVRIRPIRRGAVDDIVSGAELVAMRDMHQAFSGVAGIVAGASYTLTGFDAPQVLDGALVTHEFFPVLGIAPLLGRGFVASDDEIGAPEVVLLSHHLWATRFASDTSLVGKTLTLHDQPHTVIGVMPASLDEAGRGEEVWTPLRMTTEQRTGGGGRWLRLVARLAPGVTLAQATDAARSAVQLVARRNASIVQNVGADVKPYQDLVVGDLRSRLFILLGAVGFVLLIACVNVANLLLARGTVRARELAIRAALGAGRWRLVRQLLAESVVLAFAGAVGGVAVAAGLIKGLIAVAPTNVPRLDQTHVNGVVLSFTLGVAVLSSVLIGLVPALRSASPALQAALRDGGRGTGSGVAKERLRLTLVATEVALAMTLLTGAGLLIRAAWKLQHVDPGFRGSHVLTARLLLPTSRYSSGEQVMRTLEDIRVAAGRVPGVARSALTSVVPLSGSMMTTSIAPEGRTVAVDERLPVDIRFSSPGFFDAMEMSLLDGRDLQRTDDAGALQVTVISASLARKLWPHERAIGKRIDAMSTQRGKPNWITVAGVVSDVHDVGLDLPPAPTMYFPFTQTDPGMWRALGNSLVLVVQTTPAAETILRDLRRAVGGVDPSLPLADNHTMADLLAGSVASARFNTMLLSTLGVFALVLASVGVYGVVGYFVSQRTREIGVRFALGATPSDIWRLVLARGLAPIVAGATAGTVLSLATARLLRGQLFDVSPQDPATLAVVALTLLGVAVAATLVPARRAMRVTPAQALAAD